MPNQKLFDYFNELFQSMMEQIHMDERHIVSNGNIDYANRFCIPCQAARYLYAVELADAGVLERYNRWTSREQKE